MENPVRRSLGLFRSLLILKISVATFVPVAVVAAVGFFWEYREDRKAAERVILHEMREEALALVSAIEALGEQADLRTIVARYHRKMRAEQERFRGPEEMLLNEVFVVDAGGLVLAGSRPEITGQPLIETMGHGPMGLTAVLIGREASASDFTVVDGTKVIHISVPVRLDPQAPAKVTGAVHLMEPYALLEEAMLPGIWRRASVVAALALALVASLTLILGWVVVAPVRRLDDGMRRAREGEDVRLPVTSLDEIGDLTRSFNQMLGELRRKGATLAALYAIDRTVSQSLDLEVVLTQTLEKVCEVMAVEAGGFYLLEADGETMVLRVHRGLSPSLAEAVGRIRLGEGVSGQAVALRRPVAMDMADYPTPRLAPILEAIGIRHLASAPVIARDRVVGAINMGSRRLHPFTDEELNLLGSIGSQVGASVENARLFQQERVRRRQVEAVRAISEEITRELDLTLLLGLITRRAADIVGAVAGVVYLWDEAGQVLTPQAWHGVDDWVADLRLRPGEGVAGSVAQRREGMIINDFRTSPYATPLLLERTKHTALAAEPLLYRDRLLGVIVVTNDGTDRRFSSDDRYTLGLFAAQAAIAIENARLYDMTLRRAQQLATLIESTRALTRELDPQAVAQKILAATQVLMPGVVGRIWERVGDEEVLRLVASVGLREPVQRDTLRFGPGEGLIGLAAATGQVVSSPDVTRDPRFLYPAWAKAEGLVSCIVLPLIFGERLHGGLTVFTRTPHTFTDEEVSLLQSFAAQAAIALENAQLYAATVRQLMEGKALHDMARAIASSLKLDERLEALLERMARTAGAQRVMASLVGAGNEGRLHLHVGYDPSKADPWLRHLELSPERYPEIQEVVRTRRPLVIPDVLAEPVLGPVRKHLEPLGLRSLVTLPLLVREQAIGAVSLGYVGQGRTFTDEEIRFFQSMADLSAAAIANAQLFEKVSRAKAEWEHTVDSIPDLVAIIDTNKRLVRVNRALAERLRASPEQLIGQHCYAALHGTETPWPGCPHAQTLVTGKPATLEVEDPHLGGTFLITTAPLLDAEGRPLGCVHVARDITEMKRLEEEARQRQRFEDLSRAKSAFIATMSHELRTPLNSVLGFSDLLLEQKVAPLTEKQARYVGHIHGSGKHLLDLINDILDVSRVEAGKIELARKPVPLDEAVEATLALARPQAEKTGVALGSEIPPDLPPVLADPVRLRQILFNLLSNGLKFTPSGGLITVTARRVSREPETRGQGEAETGGTGESAAPIPPFPDSPIPAERDFLEIAVQDTGIGIKAEDIPKLFKEFGQLDAGRAPDKRGTGLGLALTKKLVELHGGRIWVESGGEGRGSTFSFTIPLAEQSKDSTPLRNPSA